jgi:hypothetical protein
MPSPTLSIPRLRACAWFEEEPAALRLAEGSDGMLELGWGPPNVAFVEPMARRRLSRLARGFCHCAQRLSPPGDVQVVFASRHGEAERTLGLLKELAAGGDLSPALFSTSVHNAVPGLWSILKGNRAAATALAAGAATFGWGLVEALGMQEAEPDAPVLYVYAEDRLPGVWTEAGAESSAQAGLHAVALLLGGEAGRGLTFHREDAPETSGVSSEALQFLAAWREGQGPWGCWRGRFH